MDSFAARRLIALEAVLRSTRYAQAVRRAPAGKEPKLRDGKPAEPDLEYELRRVMREYSDRFHTPLHQVYELDLDFVLTHYYESVFEAEARHETSERDPDPRPYLDRARDEAAETPAERDERLALEAGEDEDWLEEVRGEAAKEARVVPKVIREPARDILPDVLPEVALPVTYARRTMDKIMVDENENENENED